jgi:hypothetical protein
MVAPKIDLTKPRRRKKSDEENQVACEIHFALCADVTPITFGATL